MGNKIKYQGRHTVSTWVTKDKYLRVYRCAKTGRFIKFEDVTLDIRRVFWENLKYAFGFGG